MFHWNCRINVTIIKKTAFEKWSRFFLLRSAKIELNIANGLMPNENNSMLWRLASSCYSQSGWQNLGRYTNITTAIKLRLAILSTQPISHPMLWRWGRSGSKLGTPKCGNGNSWAFVRVNLCTRDRRIITNPFIVFLFSLLSGESNIWFSFWSPEGWRIVPFWKFFHSSGNPTTTIDGSHTDGNANWWLHPLILLPYYLAHYQY